jgi:hypothetical protein
VKCELCPAHGRRTGGPYRRVLCIPALCWAALPAEAQISWNPTPSFFFSPVCLVATVLCFANLLPLTAPHTSVWIFQR